LPIKSTPTLIIFDLGGNKIDAFRKLDDEQNRTRNLIALN
jgi:hypothetical protein